MSGHPDPEALVQAIRDLTGGAGTDVVMEFSGARTAPGEGPSMVRRGGRFLAAGQVGPHKGGVRADRDHPWQHQRHRLLLGSEAEHWRALRFMSGTCHRFDSTACCPGGTASTG